MTFFRWVVPLTRRAAPAPRTRLHVLPSASTRYVEHVLQVPRGACPVSGNPLQGTAVIGYAPTDKVVEVVSLHDALRWACSGAPGAPRSAEELAGWLSRETSSAVGVPTRAVLDLLLRPGNQRLIVTHDSESA